MIDKLTQDNMSEVARFQNCRDPADLIILKFSAEWCQPCKAMAPVIDQVQYEYADFVSFYEVDIEKSPMLTQSNNVCSVPTFIAYDVHGKEVFRKFGTLTKEAFCGLIKTTLEELKVL